MVIVCMLDVVPDVATSHFSAYDLLMKFSLCMHVFRGSSSFY